MKLIYQIGLLGLLAMSFWACSKEFETINTNTNAPEQVDAQFLLTNILWNAANNNAVDAWNAGNFLAQLTARTEFNEIDRWDIRTNTELWNKSYLLLNDVQSLEQLVDEGKASEPYRGMALVMRAFLVATLTDLWGDVPYSEAIQGRSQGNFTPSYDTQEEIYTSATGILQSLRDASAIFEAAAGSPPVQGDILYQGDLEQWLRFSNSLRVRYLLRVSEKLPVGSELQALVADNKLMQSNADNGAVPYLPTAPNQWFVHTIREGDYSNVRMSNTIKVILSAYDDPRTAVWFQPTANSQGTGTPVYDGLPNGIGPGSLGQYNLADYSTLGAIFRAQPAGVDAVLMTYSELQFALAEAANRGLIAGAAQPYYEAGIRGSFAYYNTPVPTNYLTQTGVAWTGSLEQIITQKWLASMLVGYEGWFNYRRTGFPILNLALDNTNNDLLPVRYRYPDTEKAVNTANYQAAVDRLGGDTHDHKAWW
jgi:hypothetical protein